MTPSILTTEQHMRLTKAASMGHSFSDSLILAGVPASEIECTMKNRELFDVFMAGRAQGAEKVRERLMAAAMAGNVSAMKVLALTEVSDEDERPSRFGDGLSDEERRARSAAMLIDLNQRFEAQRRLVEKSYDELNA